jgi:site-specific recombinase XerD
MAGMLVDRKREEGVEIVRRVVKKLAHEAPTLADLPEEALQRLAEVVVAEELRDELKKAARLERIDLQAERTAYLQSMKRGSPHTARSYTAALDAIAVWCARHGIFMLELSPAGADDFIESMKADGFSPATVRVRVAACSAFYTWMERRHAEVRSPFRGTRARPKRKPMRTLAVPTAEEIETIIETAGPTLLGAAIRTMHMLGVRVGALPSLTIHGDKYATESKGKTITGPISDELKDALSSADLSARTPLCAVTADALAHRFTYLCARLHDEGKIAAVYSPHDIRHAFAARLYKSTHDIYAVKTALAHASVTVTETYLRSLGIDTKGGNA